VRHFDAVVEKAKKRWKDRIKGGLADDKDPNDFDKDDLEEGRKVEREHTKDENIAREIAMDHLDEDKKYYKKLKLIEKAQAFNQGVIRSKSPGSYHGIHGDIRIGRTSSGKSIFSNPSNTAHEGFTPSDHREAYLAHAKIISRSTNEASIAQHKQALNHHFKMMNAGVQKARKRPEHKNWTKSDHRNAMLNHHKIVMRHVAKMQSHAKKGKKGALHDAAHKTLAKLVHHHAKEVHYHHTHSQGE
jgi:hypothetical protein